MTVSVLIPVYNASKFLEQCLESIVNQTYKDLQICLLNDGSSDDSESICKKFAERDNRIEYIYQQNRGVSSARNRLLQMAKGDAILFVDADDWLEHDTIDYLINLRRETDADIVCCSVVKGDNISEEKIIEENVFDNIGIIRKFLYHIDFNGSLCNKLIPLNLTDGISFDTNISYGEDALFLWQILKKTSSVAVSSKSLYHYRMNPDSLSHTRFGPKKLTANKVWEQISSDAENEYSDLAYIAHARWGMEIVQLLYAALKDKAPFSETIKNMQRLVRQKFKYMLKARITTPKGLLFACLISIGYKPFLYINKL